MFNPKSLKRLSVRIIMFFLGRAFEAAARHDAKVMHETRRWPKNLTVVMTVLPKGPSMILCKTDARLKHRLSTDRPPDLLINFKNIECAFPVMMGLMNSETGFAQNRMTVKGDIPLAMSLIRCINRVQILLFPRVVSCRILKRVPRLSMAEQAARAKVIFAGILFGL